MASVIQELKAQARALQVAAYQQDASAMKRLGLAPVRSAKNKDSHKIHQRHCLAVIASELGFSGWSHARDALNGAENEDFGTLFGHPKALAKNKACDSYDHARRIQTESGGYLLVKGKAYFVVDRSFIQRAGMDPDHKDWQRIERDWAQPKDYEARARLIRSRRAHLQ